MIIKFSIIFIVKLYYLQIYLIFFATFVINFNGDWSIFYGAIEKVTIVIKIMINKI